MTAGLILAHVGPLPWEEVGLNYLAWLAPPVLAWICYRGWTRLPGMTNRRWRLIATMSGVVIGFGVLIDPVEDMADASFAVHMAQHLVFLIGVPVLLIYGHAGRCLVAGLPRAWRARTRSWRHMGVRINPMTRIPLALVTFGVVLWAWHVPVMYDAAVRNELIHILEHSTLLGASLLFWAVIADRRLDLIPRALVVFATGFHSGLLGAILVFAPTPLYQSHLDQTLFDLQPLIDQQLAGAVMWMVMGAAFMATVATLVIRSLGIHAPRVAADA